MEQTPPANLPFADIYMDESSHTNHRYFVLGGIIVAREDVSECCAAIARARLPELPHSTLKWTKVSPAKLAAYRRCVDLLFDLQSRMTFDFHSLVVDTTRVQHGVYNQGSREIGFNKEIYQLAMKFGRLYRCLLHVYPDRRCTNQLTEDLRLMLNRGIKSKHGDTRDWPFRRLQFREPDDAPVLQLVDLFAGALAYCLNGHGNQPNASPAKVELCQYILKRAGIRDPFHDTSRAGKFTIWHRRLR